jgi:hypothetical protein
LNPLIGRILGSERRLRPSLFVDAVTSRATPAFAIGQIRKNAAESRDGRIVADERALPHSGVLARNGNGKPGSGEQSGDALRTEDRALCLRNDGSRIPSFFVVGLRRSSGDPPGL